MKASAPGSWIAARLVNAACLSPMGAVSMVFSSEAKASVTLETLAGAVWRVLQYPLKPTDEHPEFVSGHV